MKNPYEIRGDESHLEHTTKFAVLPGYFAHYRVQMAKEKDEGTIGPLIDGILVQASFYGGLSLALYGTLANII